MTNSFGSLAGSFFFVPGSALARDDVVLVLDLLLRRTSRRAAASWNSSASVFASRRGAAVLDHLLPLLQVRIELRRLRQELEPALEQLVIELLGVDDLRPLLPSARRSPSTRPACTSTPAAPASRPAARLSVCVNSSSSFSFFSIFLSCALYSSTTRLRRERVLVVRRCSGTRRPASSSPSVGIGSYL